MDKRGASDLLWNVIMAVLIVSAMVSIISWINNVSSGKLIMAQIDAKESALLADMARTGTTFDLNKSISMQGNNLTAKFGDSSFSYSTFNPKISLQKTENGTEVKA